MLTANSRFCQFSRLCTEGGRRTPWAGICFIYPKRAVLIQLSWKKLQHQCQLNQSSQLNQNYQIQNQTSSECYFSHESRMDLFQHRSCLHSVIHKKQHHTVPLLSFPPSHQSLCFFIIICKQYLQRGL